MISVWIVVADEITKQINVNMKKVEIKVKFSYTYKLGFF